MKYLWIKLKGLIAKIGLVDRFLILFMLIILLYTAIDLFTGTTDSQNGDMVDTLIRTSAASIFGYFISSNFVKTNTTNSITGSYSNSLNIPAQTNDDTLNVQSNNPNEFVTFADAIEEPVKTSVTEYFSDQTPCNKLQVIIVSSIGGCSLILLFITKFFITESSEVTAITSQLRDFVSACIGFLVSYGRTK